MAAATRPAPPRWKQMISIFIVFYPLSLTIQLVLGPVLVDLALWLRVLVIVVIASPLMTYVLLPLVTRALRPWLLRGAPRSR